MSEPRARRPLVRASERPEEESFSHPLVPNSQLHGVSLSEAAGMRRVGVNLIRIPPGKEGVIYHAHTVEEEFFYVLSGRGVAELDGEEHEVGPGDFMGFSTPSVAHCLRNPFEEDLVYLVGGERREIEVGDLPRLRKRVLRLGRVAYTVDEDALQPFRKAAE